MDLYFITSSKMKVEEARQIIPKIKQLDIDLPEVQELDSHAIIKEKLTAAMGHHKGEFIVEDTGLYCEGLNGLPGPLVKWFLKAVGAKGIANMVLKSSSTKASAKSLIGYAKSPDEIYFFEGEVQGRIVPPRGEHWGWDSIFEPEGHTKTFAEMPEQKKLISHRNRSMQKLKEFLNQQHRS